MRVSPHSASLVSRCKNLTLASRLAIFSFCWRILTSRVFILYLLSFPSYLIFFRDLQLVALLLSFLSLSQSVGGRGSWTMDPAFSSFM